ncbi:hypothetical protein HDU92_007545 [Lobulomyces angularis]|nr:hypothetical protein HDU92_007545 [Lobulomyces angularis]
MGNIISTIVTFPLTLFGYISQEQPAYDVLSLKKGFQVRKYGSQLRASFTFSIDPSLQYQTKGMCAGYKPLSDYITGQNVSKSIDKKEVDEATPVLKQKQVNIAMTAPVLTSQSKPGEQTMTFLMPPKYTLDSIPLPLNTDVKLMRVPEHTVAVLKFNGHLNAKLVEVKEQQLRKACEEEGVKLDNDKNNVQVASYNPPWTFGYFRTNEIFIPVVG